MPATKNALSPSHTIANRYCIKIPSSDDGWLSGPLKADGRDDVRPALRRMTNGGGMNRGCTPYTGFSFKVADSNRQTLFQYVLKTLKKSHNILFGYC
jgi:hypothetical protein